MLLNLWEHMFEMDEIVVFFGGGWGWEGWWKILIFPSQRCCKKKTREYDKLHLKKSVC